MNLQQFIPLAIVLTVAVIFVWRSSGSKPHQHDCGCGCDHEHDHAPTTKQEKTGAKISK